jgi:hypothetical protein
MLFSESLLKHAWTRTRRQDLFFFRLNQPRCVLTMTCICIFTQYGVEACCVRSSARCGAGSEEGGNSYQVRKYMVLALLLLLISLNV